MRVQSSPLLERAFMEATKKVRWQLSNTIFLFPAKKSLKDSYRFNFLFELFITLFLKIAQIKYVELYKRKRKHVCGVSIEF